MDPVLQHDWHPVAASAAVPAGQIMVAELLGTEIALWRGADGDIRAWENRCPHRGMRLTLGRIENDAVVCRYHGWRYDAAGRCVHVPSQPDHAMAQVCVGTYVAIERYGLVWVCLGTPGRRVLPFPEYEDARLRKVLCGPYPVAASGPRVVENFLDMAHFAFVHAGILGEAGRTEVREYAVVEVDDGEGGKALSATGCYAWQPRTNSLAHGGSWVEYTYRVVRPLTAILTKVPEAQRGFHEAISLHVQPVGEEASIAWIVLAMTNFDSSDDDLRAFQDTIFLQDRPILENQMPKRLPLAARTEVSVRADRMSLAYRSYLRAVGLTYGVTPA